MTALARTKPSRRVMAIGVGVVFGLVLLELVQQVVAFVVWSTEQRGAPEQWDREAAGTVALCVGDSFTFGLHASSRQASYPAQAQALVGVDATGASRTFVNEGYPGQTSRDVLARLGAQIARYRPDVVYVLVGTNDHYFRPAELEAGAESTTESSGFPWRLRTRRLFLVLVEWLAGGRAERDAQRPFVGVWHTNTFEMEFAADGTFRFGDNVWRWSLDPAGRLNLAEPDGRVVLVEWHLEGPRLYVQCVAWNPPFLLEPGPMPGPITQVRAAHFARIAGLCAASNARLALLTYPGGPYAAEGLNDDIRRAAREHGVDLIDVEARFLAIAKDEDLAAYYVGDGHCSDRGYAEIARLVVAHLENTPRARR
jgi:hypothetical protein